MKYVSQAPTVPLGQQVLLSTTHFIGLVQKCGHRVLCVCGEDLFNKKSHFMCNSAASNRIITVLLHRLQKNYVRGLELMLK
jgi:hypothetical protein